MKYKTLLTTIALITAGLLVRPVLAAESGDLLKPYEAVSTALANDDLAAAKTAATGLAKQAKSAGNETIATHAAELARSGSLEVAREHFKAMSDEVAKLAKASGKYHVVNCPMAKANWAQLGDKIMNPYLGKKMQQCGSMIKG
jgi:hypothetical protein